MAEDVLSQNEIDKLLSALSTGEVSAEEVQAEEEERKVKTYDFKRPDKFSKDQIRTLNMLYENFARLLNTHLSTHLRTMVNVEVVSVEQLTYQEFLQSLSNPSVIGVMALPPLKGNIIMEVNTGIAFAYIDRVFGGLGENTLKPRILTEIEEAVMRKFIAKASEYLKESWSNVVEINPILEAIEANPGFVQIVPPSDMVIIVTVQVKIGEVEGFMTLCIPYLVLEPVMSKLSTSFWVAASVAKDNNPEKIRALERKIHKSPIPLIVELGTIDMTIREFLTLGFGDVLQLDTKAKDELKILVGQKPKFLCRPGTQGKRSAVQITQITFEGDEDTDE